MKVPSCPRRDWLLGLAVILAVTIAGFSIVTMERQELLGVVPAIEDPSWRSLTVQSFTALRNWYDVGALHSKFGVFLSPITVDDYPRYDNFVSYPPGFLFLPHLLQVISGQPFSYRGLMLFSSFAHFFFALTFGIFAFALLQQFRKGALFNTTLGASVAIVCLFYSSAQRWFQNCWWSDIMAVAVFPAFLLIYLWYEERPHSPRRQRMLAVVSFFAAFTDWFFLILLFSIALFTRNRKMPFKDYFRSLAGPGLVGMVVFSFYLLVLGDLPQLLSRFWLRAGLTEGAYAPGKFSEWFAMLPVEIGKYTFFLSMACLAFGFVAYALSFRPQLKNRRKILRLYFAVSLSVVVHFLLLRQHYIDHTYENLKFVLPVLMAMIATPVLWRKSYLLLPVVVPLLAVEGREVQTYFEKEAISAKQSDVDLCERIAGTAEFRDVVFSPDFQIIDKDPRFPPGMNPYLFVFPICHRQIFPVKNPEDWARAVRELRKAMSERRADTMPRMNVLLKKPASESWARFLSGETAIDFGEYELYQLSEKYFLKFY